MTNEDKVRSVGGRTVGILPQFLRGMDMAEPLVGHLFDLGVDHKMVELK